MFTRLVVKDFQSIADADIELSPFSIIVGENRSGKTALLRALRNVITNRTGAGFIRRGKSKCVVEITTAEGDKIVWEKNKTTATYTLNDRAFSKMAGSVPDEVRDALGVREVIVDNTLTLSPQVAMNASDNLFLIDKSPGQAARALAKLTRLDVVVKAQVLCKQVIRRFKDELKAAQSNIGRTQEELDEFTDLEVRGKSITKATKTHESIASDLLQLALVNIELRALDIASDPLYSKDVELITRHREAFCPTLPVDIDNLEDALAIVELLDSIVVRNDIPLVDLSEDIEHLHKANGWCMNLPYEIEEVERVHAQCEALAAEDAALGDALASFKGEECPLCGGTI